MRIKQIDEVIYTGLVANQVTFSGSSSMKSDWHDCELTRLVFSCLSHCCIALEISHLLMVIGKTTLTQLSIEKQSNDHSMDDGFRSEAFHMLRPPKNYPVTSSGIDANEPPLRRFVSADQASELNGNERQENEHEIR